MGNKPGFMMYHDALHAMEELEAESFKRVLCAACRYSETGEETKLPNMIERVVFGVLKGKLDADWDRYQGRVEAGRKGGKRSGESRRRGKAEQNEGNFEANEGNFEANEGNFEANEGNFEANEANEPTITIPITTTITPTITTTITSGNSSNSHARAREDGEEEAFPPTLEMVEKYIREKDLRVDGREFLSRCEAAGWKDGKGEPVTNWRLWLKGYAIRAAIPEAGGAARLGMDPRLAALEAMKGGGGG